jgi:hypothetical protein
MMMHCEQCNADIEQGDEREHLGRLLCEDCYMDALSPVRTCDPWAVHSAKSFEAHTGGTATMTPIQTEILGILRETGGVESHVLLERLKGKLTEARLKREFATLRHMEKARAEKRGDKVVLRPW